MSQYTIDDLIKAAGPTVNSVDDLLNAKFDSINPGHGATHAPMGSDWETTFTIEGYNPVEETIDVHWGIQQGEEVNEYEAGVPINAAMYHTVKGTPLKGA